MKPKLKLERWRGGWITLKQKNYILAIEAAGAPYYSGKSLEQASSFITNYSVILQYKKKGMMYA